MPGNTPTHFVFVDFENVPKVDLALIEGKPVHVTLLIGKHQTKLELGLVQQIRRTPDQVDLVEVGATGHNALDIILASYLGRAIERAPTASYAIISKDKDFDAMIAHWKGKGVAIERQSSVATLPFLQPPKPTRTGKTRAPFQVSAEKATPTVKPQPTPKPARETDKFPRLARHIRNTPPKTRTSLEHTIANFYKKTQPEGGIEGIIATLEKQKIVSIDAAGKVIVQ